MDKRDLKIIAEAKQKEFKKLSDCALNQMSIIEVGLNPNSQSRNPYGTGWITVPTIKQIRELSESLLELRSNQNILLTVEERNALDD